VSVIWRKPVLAYMPSDILLTASVNDGRDVLPPRIEYSTASDVQTTYELIIKLVH